ncbi:LysM peptidoglycan-binding domain-containing protein [Kushneria sinocarnis]|uniref:LysM peptidoglycan-binding domain-containing protein n=1 Tax=Kushneria sinocarnis TaxID=595502 RepID=UPI000EABB24A|nr:LysM domain-containing protein [Kushneria sinocarnis]
MLGLWLWPGVGLAAAGASHTVQPGETLWEIAEQLQAPPWAWETADPARPLTPRPGDRVHRTPAGLSVERVESAVVRLSPQMRRLPPREEITPVPMAPIRVWLTEHRIVTACCDRLPRVVAGEQGQLLSVPGQRILARGLQGEPGRYYGLYTPAGTIRDASGSVRGYSLEGVGEARLERVDSSLAMLTLVRSQREVAAGALLLPREDDIPPESLWPHAPPSGVTGHVIRDPDAADVIAPHDVITIDLGRRDGITPGTVLGIYRDDPGVRDPRTREPLALPPRRIGLALVFRSDEGAGHALVMQADEPIAPGDRLAAPRS